MSALGIAAEQAKLGHDIHMIISKSDHSQAFIRRAEILGLKATETANSPASPLHKRLIPFWRSLLPYREYVLHYHSGYSQVRTVDVMAMRAVPFNIRVATVHSGYEWETTPDYENRKKRWKSGSKGLDAVICPSRRSLDIQKQAGLPPELLKVIANPVDVKRFSQGNRERVRNQLGLHENDFAILFLARIDVDKCPQATIQAFARLAFQFPHTHLIMAGSGGEEADCQRIADELGVASRVHFLGYRKDTEDLYKAADLYVLPTLIESFGISVVEAMASGLPIVTSPVMEQVGVVSHNESALIADPKNPQEIADKMASVITDAALRQRLQKQSLMSCKRFDGPIVAMEHIDLYTSLMDLKGRS